MNDGIPNPRRAVFDELAPTWDSTFVLTGEQSETLRRVMASLSLPPGASVLDVGCGTGVLVPYLLPLLGEGGNYTGIDVSERMVVQARRKFNDHRVRFEARDLYDPSPYPRSYDALIIFSAFPHLHDKEAVLDIAFGLLKAGGKLCIVHVESSTRINEFHRTRVRQEAIRHDRLPSLGAMRAMIDRSRWREVEAQDREGLYLILLKRQ
jgi:ubiquinone/menaquinone biosynthesis C-methylase UbiE